MAYDRDFYLAYEQYLQEDAVRWAHQWVFRTISLYPQFDNVIDLGCGTKEFQRFARPTTYCGIDLNTGDIKEDYRLLDYGEIKNVHRPWAFVSLFSSEITAPPEVNYPFYEKVMKDLDISVGLVSGFYYVNRKNSRMVEESGDISSFQCIENIEDVPSNVFTEIRITLPVPSKLFGPDVYEVWKIFEKES